MKTTIKNTFKHPNSWMGLIAIIICLNFLSCKKQDDWLNVKNKKSSVTPITLADFQAILDNAQIMNNSCPIQGLVGTDNVYFTDASIGGLAVTDRNSYLWQKDIFQGSASADWQNAYQSAEYANIVLDGLNNIDQGATTTDFNNVKGEALFFRAFSFYNLSQLFCKPYIPATASSDLGIPLRLTSDVNQKTVRSSVGQTYTQIINDLKQALTLLPTVALYKTRPSANAAQILLSKVYLAMQDYADAMQYAEAALKLNNTLLDFKTLNVSSSQPFPSLAKGNTEIVLYASAIGNSSVWPLSSTGRVAPDLYATYDNNDLRKQAFYSLDAKTNTYEFKGSYEQSDFYDFTGLAINELYLIHAECALRLSNPTTALSDLNTLLKARYDITFVPLQISNASALLTRIILERRKELPFSGNIRWEDLRRFNQSTTTAVSISHSYKGTTYTLPANSPLYTLPIPQNEIETSGIQQNLR